MAVALFGLDGTSMDHHVNKSLSLDLLEGSCQQGILLSGFFN
jgi:hypothetical protein